MRRKEPSHPDPRRQYKLLPTDPAKDSWCDVPDSVILDLVRTYTRSGDAILFGTSKAQDVLAIRVYRGGEGYSVYSRNVQGVGEAVDRLYRTRPPRIEGTQSVPVRGAEAQGIAIDGIPFHPKFTLDDLRKQRAKEDERARAWNALIDTFPKLTNVVAFG